jgi:sucrose-6-phosphate hydrolase SacC (GH32 family)
MAPRLIATSAIIFSAALGYCAEPQEGAKSQFHGWIVDKTLVAWVSPTNLQQQGGGVISLMEGEKFDAMVLGEKRQGVWMAGSDFFRRTQADQSTSPPETIRPGQQVQIAVVYRGNRITIFRDGRPYADYQAGTQESFLRNGDILIGVRYRGAMGEIGFWAGDVDEVRLYDEALDEKTIPALKPGELGQPKPWGMWTFDEGEVVDRMGHYPKGRLMNGAAIVGGKLRLGGRSEYALVSAAPPPVPAVQAGFFTPARRGSMWDTWAYYHDGRYYLYYLAGRGGHWDGHELATSDDGVHWKEHGVVVKPRDGVQWMGTGHIWKSPDFDRSHQWVMNYSEWFGDKQDIMFVTSTDLLNWTKVDEKHRFVQDPRWYKPKGRWDCIDTVERPDGGLYGYFTADPEAGKVAYRPCGFGFCESKDGVAWTALPPVEGNISGELGGIQKIGGRYYVLISEGRVAVGDKPEGPFYAQRKNPNVFGPGCDIYFPRFFHNAPGGPLVNHFYTGGTVFAGPLKAVEADGEGTLRLRWWNGNDRLKAKRLDVSLLVPGNASPIRMLDTTLDLSKVHVLEGTMALPSPQTAGDRYGIFFDHDGKQGSCIVLDRQAARFGQIKTDGSDLAITQTSSRDMDFGPTLKFRLLIREDMAELYVNDYLMNLKRVRCNGKIGFLGDGIRGIEVWQSN